jgi:AbrB family looped-hinge helix DNA binding protein
MTVHAKLTSKGQITLPKKLRDELGLDVGDTIAFTQNQSGGYTLAKVTPDKPSLAGLIDYDGPTLTKSDIVQLVEASRRGEGAQMLKRLKGKERERA